MSTDEEVSMLTIQPKPVPGGWIAEVRYAFALVYTSGCFADRADAEMDAPASPRSRRRRAMPSKVPATVTQRDSRRLGLLAARRRALLLQAQAHEQAVQRTMQQARKPPHPLGRLMQLGDSASPEQAAAQMRAASEALRGCAGGRTVVLVHSPSCGFCRQMRPNWDAAVPMMNGQGVHVLEVDRNTLGYAPGLPLSRTLSAGMRGVPHILRIGPGAGDNSMYDGDRSVSSLLSFAMRQ
jgi:hypothetical protein